MGQPFYVYMLLCADGTYYVGHTDDMENRLAEHQHGGKCVYTSRRRPVRLVWCESLPTRDEAKIAERRVKKWSQAKKSALIRGDFAGLSEAAKKRDWEGHKQRLAARSDSKTNALKSETDLLEPSTDLLEPSTDLLE
ncbi:MAG: GIY-YIG nuclease family protein [Armatimonadetes bacterium]|nr:GIY-YIG nuclease family protein [Armatimonadota bacterium]